MNGCDFEAFLLLLVAVCCSGVSSNGLTTPLTCHFYTNNTKECTRTGSCIKTNTTCIAGEYCYAFWTNDSHGVFITHQGCWLDTNAECDRTACNFGRKLEPYSAYFCCCNTDYCNEELSVAPEKPIRSNKGTLPDDVSTIPSFVSTTSSPPTAPKDKTIQTLLYSILPIFGFAVVLVFGFFMYHRHKTSFPTRIFEEEPLNTLPPPSPELGVRPIQLVEVISQGQFGTVWKADYLQDVVAVKVFPPSHKAAWACEREMFASCNMKHENILNFIAAEKHTDGSQYVELWIVTQYQENGSLADYLKSHVINWTELCGMAGSMASGLAYLHTEVPGAFSKPCIAHRDFKSKNVLVKKDLTCCLSDFGLAMKFQPGGDPGETHGQVGTRRYMAPEVLEGAINFTRESFLHIDVYAFALVLWELASRCSAVDGPVDEYRLPFEEEVGSHPSLEDMQQAVVHKKIRPKFRPDWSVHSGMASIIQTIEDCWDQDAEARLTAQCVAERVAQLHTTPNSGSEIAPAVTTVVNDTNISTSSRESTI